MDEYNNNPNDIGSTPPPPQEQQNPQPQQNQQPYPPSYYSGQQQDGQQGYSQPHYTQPAYSQPTRGEVNDNGYTTKPYQWDFENMQRQAQAAPPKKKRKGLRIFGIVAASIALTVTAGFACFGIYAATVGNDSGNLLPVEPGISQSESMPEVAIMDKPAGATTAIDVGLSNADIFKKTSPSVVGIVSNVTVNIGNSILGGGNYGGGFAQEAQEQGSGIILSADGYIITNAHVVANANSIEVVLADEKTYEAVVIGSDTQTDLAVIKIEATGLPAAEFGNSDQLEVGERVVAIGNPGGLQFASSLTVGYVSALNRVLSSGEAGYALECIQTDAAINPGNSGGALINAYGQVVGINSAKISSADFEGMGFAIPISDAMPIIQDMITNGKVTGRAMMGITVTEVGAAEAQAARLPMGLRIAEFTTDSDLPGKGAKVGDIITHINNTPVYNTTGSADILKAFKPGDTVTLTLYRVDNRGRAGSLNIDVVLSAS